MSNETRTTIIPAEPGWFIAVFIPAGKDAKEEWPARFDLEPRCMGR